MINSMVDSELLISYVRERPPLWDQSQHDKILLQKLWTEVANKCNASEIAVKRKWKSLRDNYRNFCKRNQGSKKVGWKWYESLTFLNPTIKGISKGKRMPPSRRNVCQADSSETNSVSINPTATISSVPSCKCNEVLANVNNLSKEPEKFVNIGVQTQGNSHETTPTFMPAPTAPILSVQCKCNNVPHTISNKPFEDALTIQERGRLELLHALSKQEEERDTTYHFLMSLKDPINSLTVYEQMFVRLKFMEIVTHIIQSHCERRRTPSPS